MRAGILTAARQLFRERGYERVTLTDIGAAVGLTRGAVLYHYHSKADVLAALLAPFIASLNDLLDQFESARQRPLPSEVLAGVLGTLLATRAAAEVLLRDVSGRHALALDAWVSSQAERLIALLVPDNAGDPIARVRALAALGALARPLAALPDPIPETHREAREAILYAASNALRSPGQQAAGAPRRPSG